MKKNLFVALISVFAFTACSSGPTDAARDFSESVAKGNIDEAKTYATESTGKLLDLANSVGAVKARSNFKFDVVKDSVVGDKAWVSFKDETGTEQQLELVKIGDKWLVNVDVKK